jgi:hypothetical protein
MSGASELIHFRKQRRPVDIAISHLLVTMPPIHTVTAVLGPTNTGKTHLAVERMLAHGGMIGLPPGFWPAKSRSRAVDVVTTPWPVTGEEKSFRPRPAIGGNCRSNATRHRRAVPAIDEVQLAPISNAATFSPTGFCTGGAMKKPCFLALPP